VRVIINYVVVVRRCNICHWGCVSSGQCIFFNSHSGGVESILGPLNGLLYLPRVIVMMGNLVN
jgi:hypothetical protein